SRKPSATSTGSTARASRTTTRSVAPTSRRGRRRSSSSPGRAAFRSRSTATSTTTTPTRRARARPGERSRSPSPAPSSATGGIVGAIPVLGGERIEIRARRGVLVATGSYGNASWAAGAEGLPELHEASPPVLHGDGIRLTDPTPAALVRIGQAFTVVGLASPG